MKNDEVIMQFFAYPDTCCENSTGSLSVKDYKLYSYNTCIAEFDKTKTLYLNITKYSATTSRHQSLVIRHCPYSSIEIDDIPINSHHIIREDIEDIKSFLNE